MCSFFLVNLTEIVWINKYLDKLSYCLNIWVFGQSAFTFYICNALMDRKYSAKRVRDMNCQWRLELCFLHFTKHDSTESCIKCSHPLMNSGSYREHQTSFLILLSSPILKRSLQWTCALHLLSPETFTPQEQTWHGCSWTWRAHPLESRGGSSC